MAMISKTKIVVAPPRDDEDLLSLLKEELLMLAKALRAIRLFWRDQVELSRKFVDRLTTLGGMLK